VAQETAPESRIVYVDNDPIVLAHARESAASPDLFRTRQRLRYPAGGRFRARSS